LPPADLPGLNLEVFPVVADGEFLIGGVVLDETIF
jgi:hypothetical protein